MEPQKRRFRVGLSFPGELRYHKVEPIADLLRYRFGEERILYDHFHKGPLAAPRLEIDLPAYYHDCDLVVVFLCRRYHEKEWCGKEWSEVKKIVADLHAYRRVMYLWHGEMEDEDLCQLGVSVGKDGFLYIDGEKPYSIAEEIRKRLKWDQTSDERDQPVAFQPAVALPAVQMRSDPTPLSTFWQLRIMVTPHRTNQPFGTHYRYQMAPLLISPTGMGQVPREERKDNEIDPPPDLHNLDLRDLARQIIYLYPTAVGKVLKQTQRDEPLLVCLYLPAALLMRETLRELLLHLRAWAEYWEIDEPPITLACSSRYRLNDIYPDPQWEQSRNNLNRRFQRWTASWNQPSQSLAKVPWLLIHDTSAPANTPTTPHLPQALKATTTLSGEDFDNFITPGPEAPRRLRDPLADQHSLFLHWEPEITIKNPLGFERRIQKVLTAGIPFFWMDSPNLSPPSTSAEITTLPAPCDHPGDGLLAWKQGEFAGNYHTLHRPLPLENSDPGNIDMEHLCIYIRDSILFWEDPRPPLPQPGAPSAAFTSPFHG